MATPYPFFTAIYSDIHRQRLNSAAYHGVEKRHTLRPFLQSAIEPGLLVIFARMRSLHVDIEAITWKRGNFNVLIDE